MVRAMILYLAADLIWGTKIKGTAESLGLQARPARSLEMLEARLADSPVAAIVLDLEKPEEALAMIGRLRGASASDSERSIRIVCWAPHVETERMEQARQAGADQVMARGAFDHNLPRILMDLSGGEA
jgi:hypothetical protein